MTKRDSVGYWKVLDKVRDLSPTVQKKIYRELSEYIEFLEFKNTTKKTKKVANPELSQEQKKELLRRLDHAKSHPEKLLSAQEMKSRWSRKIGIISFTMFLSHLLCLL